MIVILSIPSWTPASFFFQKQYFASFFNSTTPSPLSSRPKTLHPILHPRTKHRVRHMIIIEPRRRLPLKQSPTIQMNMARTGRRVIQIRNRKRSIGRGRIQSSRTWERSVSLKLGRQQEPTSPVAAAPTTRRRGRCPKQRLTRRISNAPLPVTPRRAPRPSRQSLKPRHPRLELVLTRSDARIPAPW